METHGPIRWDKSKVIQALRRRRKKGLPLNHGAIDKSDTRLRKAIDRYFGSHDAALSAAGFDPAAERRQFPWDEPRVVRTLLERRDRGEDLNTGAIQQSDGGLANAIRRYFGSHDAALRGAGIDPDSTRKRLRWDKAAIVRALRDRHAKGMSLWTGAVQKSDPSLAGAIQRHFDSHDDALRAAQINPDSVRRMDWWDKPSIVAALLARRAKGLCMHLRAIAASEPRLASATQRHFGSHDAALRAARIDPASVRWRVLWDTPAVLSALRGLARDGSIWYGLAKAGKPSVIHAATHRFGSLEAAVRAAGLRYVRLRPRRGETAGHWTEQLVLQSLRELHQRGHDLRYRHMKVHSQPLFFAAKQLFGSYVNAVRQAEINYWEMSALHNGSRLHNGSKLCTTGVRRLVHSRPVEESVG